jgi:spore coat polysaccharide biosynthesis protein SpsF (cytidylyltransferase family)
VNFVLDRYDGASDWVGNSMKTTFPPGQEVEVLKNRVYQDAELRSRGLAVREHATLFLRQHPELYKLTPVMAPARWAFPQVSLELDEPADLEFLNALSEKFGQRVPEALDEIIDCLRENPDIGGINAAVARRWKQFREES